MMVFGLVTDWSYEMDEITLLDILYAIVAIGLCTAAAYWWEYTDCQRDIAEARCDVGLSERRSATKVDVIKEIKMSSQTLFEKTYTDFESESILELERDLFAMWEHIQIPEKPQGEVKVLIWYEPTSEETANANKYG